MLKASFSQKLLTWYDQWGRTLPWRNSRTTPYQTWLSEIMLQQTVVKTVIPYYERFLEKWPNFHSLGQASLDEVLLMWQGLGYYARARNLLKCAQVVSSQHKGELPKSYTELLKLPGLGPYTASAIASIVLQEKVPVLDGNIVRVLSRYFHIVDPYPQSRKQLEKVYLDVLEDRPGDFAQALMDLSQKICRPKNPDCLHCPLQKECAALATNSVHQLPTKMAKTKIRKQFSIAWILQKGDNSSALQKRPSNGLLGGLYEVPTTPSWDTNLENPEILTLITQKPFRILGQITHQFTHIHLTLDVRHIIVDDEPTPPQFIWVDPKQRHYALSTLMKKVINLV